MTWSIAFKAPNKAAAQVELTMQLAKAMLAQKPHARDHKLVHRVLEAAIDVCEEGEIDVRAAGHVGYDGWDAAVPRILGVNVNFGVTRVGEALIQPAA